MVAIVTNGWRRAFYRRGASVREVNVQADIVKRIQANPKYTELVTQRRSFGWMLSIIMLVIYYGFVLVVAFNPALLGTKIGAGVTTLGIPVGIAVILSAFILTGIYVVRANGRYDRLIADIKAEALK
jgi:uncharacterized membrane protein (DUF485 family)